MFAFKLSYRNQLGDFPTYFTEYSSSADHRLGPGNETKIKLHYRRVVKNCSDPYKRYFWGIP